MEQLSKALKDSLQSLEQSKTGLCQTQQDGLTKAVTATSTSQAIIVIRQNPLTDAQLTEIASQTLQEPFMITSRKVTKYGRKLITDNGDSYYAENEPIGEEEITEISVSINDNKPMIRAALCLSPKEAYLKHLTHLAIHKHFGSNDADRKILLMDYVNALSSFPEFIVWLVCKNYWENDMRPFIPYIHEIKEACSLLTEKYEKFLKNGGDNFVKIEKKKEESAWKPPTDEEKAKAHDLCEEALRILSNGDD